MSPLQTAERSGTTTVPTAIQSMITARTPTVARRHPVAPISRQAPTRAPCRHHPQCPAADAVDRCAARVVAAHPEQGWSLLCNGVISFDDYGELLPDGRMVAPHRAPAWRGGLAA
jgi:hypothetical protein